MLIQTDEYVYIIELKRDKYPDDALDQIDENGYDLMTARCSRLELTFQLRAVGWKIG